MSDDFLDSRLGIWNESFRVFGQATVQVESQLEFTFNVKTYNSNEPFQPPDEVEAKDSSHLDMNIDTLYARTREFDSRSLSVLDTSGDNRVHSEVISLNIQS